MLVSIGCACKLMRGVPKCMPEDAGTYKRGPGAPLAPQVQRTNLFQQLLLSPIEEPDIFAFARAGANGLFDS